MKRFTAFLLTIVTAFAFAAMPVSAASSDLALIINGEKQTGYTLSSVFVGTANNQMLAPANNIAEKLGAVCSASATAATITKGETTIVFAAGSSVATVNGSEAKLETPAKNTDGVLHVPVEFVGDKLGYRVLKERAGNRVRIISRTSTTAPAVSTQIKPGMDTIYSTVHRPVPTEFTKSNRLDDLIFIREDYSDVAAKVAPGRTSVVPTGPVIFTQEQFINGMLDTSNYNSTYGLTAEKVSASTVGLRGPLSMKVKMAGQSIGQATNGITGFPFTHAVRINSQVSTTTDLNSWTIHVGELPSPQRDDNYVMTFYARLISGGDTDYGTGKVNIQVQSPAPDWFKTVDKTFEFGKEWTRFDVLLTGYEAAKYVRVQPVVEKQVVEIGGFEVRDVGMNANTDYFEKKEEPLADELKPDAQWRKEALGRIEEIRKGDFKVVVKDKNGNPVPNANVKFDMFEHEFKFGIQQDMESVEDEYWAEYQGLDNNGTKEKLFRDRRGALFNALSVGNRLKWPCYAHDKMYNPDLPSTARVVIDKANEDGIKYVRGHALWMPSLSTTEHPQELYDLLDPNNGTKEERYAKFKELVTAHFKEMNDKFPEIYEWDVTNETHGRTYFTNAFGTQIFNDVYKIAAEQLTNGQKLMLCDNRQFEDQYWDRLDWFKEQGIRYDSLGMQGHSRLGSNDTENSYRPEKWLEVWDRFAYEYQKTFAVTEFSTASLHNEYGFDGQGDYMRDIMIAAFSHPACTGFNLWWMSDYWSDWNTVYEPTNPLNKGNGAGVSPLYTQDFDEKPGLQIFKDLLYNKWWTRNENVTTNSKGEGTINGYYGDYDVTVTVNGSEKTVMAAFHKGYENVLTLTID